MKKTASVILILFIGGYELYNSFKTAPELKETDQKRVRIMTYNVENLFDTEDDPKKNDETFLPVLKKNKKVQKACQKSGKKHWIKECLTTNWTDFKLELKMKRLAEVILAANPDILILQEVENLNVLNMFNKKHLGFSNVILKEGPDRRGIDVAILSKLENAGKPKLHLQRSNHRVKATRGILEAHLKLPNNETVTVFGIHFPSQGSPFKARKEAVELLNRLVSSKRGLVVAGGDFNIIKNEEKLYKQDLSKKWMVSHLVGCKKCEGTNYYHRRRSWSFLDALLFSNSFKASQTWSLDKKSIQVFKTLKVQKNRYGSPQKFEMGKHPTGVSDHFPVVAEIKL